MQFRNVSQRLTFTKSSFSFALDHFTMTSHVVVGVLSIQGSFVEHVNGFKNLQRKDCNVKVKLIRCPEDLDDQVLGLTIPGGESTTISHFLSKQNFLCHIKKWMASKPTKFLFGTCAGLIMLSNDVENVKEGGQARIGGLEIVASRNSYGRQRESFEQDIILKNSQLINCIGGNTGLPSFEGVFIRAPKIIRITGLNQVQGEFFNQIHVSNWSLKRSCGNFNFSCQIPEFGLPI